MNKRLDKLHKRKVARAKAQVNVSEPDLRTPEQLKAAREASRPAGSLRNNQGSQLATQPVRSHAMSSGKGTAKADVGS